MQDTLEGKWHPGPGFSLWGLMYITKAPQGSLMEYIIDWERTPAFYTDRPRPEYADRDYLVRIMRGWTRVYPQHIALPKGA